MSATGGSLVKGCHLKKQSKQMYQLIAMCVDRIVPFKGSSKIGVVELLKGHELEGP